MSNQREDLTFKWGLDADAFRRQLTRINADVQKSTEGIKGRLAEAFTITAAALAFKEIGDQMVELRRKSEDLGVSIEGLQAIERLGKSFGGTSEQIGNALQKLTVMIGNARTEGGAAEESFSRFGIALYNLDGTAKNTEEVFKNIADAYKNTTDASAKAALAFEFFGKTGKDINNILDMGSQELTDYAAKVSGTLTVSVENVNALADAWLKVKDAFAGTGVFANAVGWMARVVNATAATLGALAGGATLEQAQAIAGQQDINTSAQERERARNAEEADRAMRAAKQRDAIARAAQGAAELARSGDEIKNRRELISLTMQELAARARLIVAGNNTGRARNEAAVLEIVRKRAAAEDKAQTDKLAALQMEERQIKHQIEWEKDALKSEQLRIELKKKQNDIAEQGNKIAEANAKIMAEANTIQAQAKDLVTKREDRTKFSLQELAGANLRGVSEEARGDVLKAREAVRLEAEATRLSRSLAPGSQEQAQRLFSQADAIKQSIGLLRSDEKLSSIDRQIGDMNKQIAEMNARQAGPGIKMIPILAR